MNSQQAERRIRYWESVSASTTDASIQSKFSPLLTVAKATLAELSRQPASPEVNQKLESLFRELTSLEELSRLESRKNA